MTMMSGTIIAFAIGGQRTGKKPTMANCVSPMVMEDETIQDTEGNPKNDNAEDNAKRNCSLQKSPNQDRRK